LLIAPVATLLLACQGEDLDRHSGSSAMYDCRFETNELIHLHVSRERGTASVITQYQSGLTESHSGDVRQGRESNGRLVAPGPSRYAVELFLLNDRLGQKPGEKVILRVAADGRALLEGQAVDGQLRRIDFGICSPHKHGRH
jgi:hypothetical protein